jgi:hypothetical protein
MGATGTRGGRARRLGLGLLWALGAVAATVGGRAWIDAMSRGSTQQLSVELGSGATIGILVGLLVGLRIRRLWGLVLGVPVGLLAGFADLRLLGVVLTHTELDVETATLMPIWGLVIGLWASCSRPRVIEVFIVTSCVALADLGARWAYVASYPEIQAVFARWAAWGWISEALTFAPPAVLAVLLTGPALRPASRERQP